MNPWFPYNDEADALKHARVVNLTPSAPLKALINAGWTIPALSAQGYIEYIPQPPKLPPAGDTSMPPPLMTPSSPQPSDIAQSVVDQVLSRDAHGQRKYGVSLDRTDLDTPTWLQHMAEELMDGAHYALAAKREIERMQQAAGERYGKAMKATQDNAKSLLSDADYKVAERVLSYFRKHWLDGAPK